jgi:hypothetical protein
MAILRSNRHAPAYDKGNRRVQPETYSTVLARRWLLLTLTSVFDRTKDSTLIQDCRRASSHIVLRSYSLPLKRECFLQQNKYKAQFKIGKGRLENFHACS